jgi:hypothetical protein
VKLGIKIRSSLASGRKSTYELANDLWPIDTQPQAWRTPKQGGPPSWVRTLGGAIKNYGLIVEIENDRKFVRLP